MLDCRANGGSTYVSEFMSATLSRSCDGDLMGDGVNIAGAASKGVAQPGAICLSEDAFRQVRSRLEVAVNGLGPV